MDFRYYQDKAGEKVGVQLLWRAGRRVGGSGPGTGGYQAPDPRGGEERGRVMMKVLDWGAADFRPKQFCLDKTKQKWTRAKECATGEGTGGSPFPGFLLQKVCSCSPQGMDGRVPLRGFRRRLEGTDDKGSIFSKPC